MFLFFYPISMKILLRLFVPLGLGALVVCAGANHAFAQKRQLKYLPQALKGSKLPYVVNPNLSLSRWQVLERMLAEQKRAAQRVQSAALLNPTFTLSTAQWAARMCDYGGQGRSPNRTPEQVYAEVTQFMREHEGRVPSRSSINLYERKLRKVWDRIYDVKQGSNDPYVVRLIQLHRENVKEMAADKTPQEVLEQLQTYRREHQGKIPMQTGRNKALKSLRNAWYQVYKNYKNVPLETIENETVRALVAMYRQTVREKAQARTPQEILGKVKQYRAEHNGANPSTYSPDKETQSWRRSWDRIVRQYRGTALEDIADPAARELVRLQREP